MLLPVFNTSLNISNKPISFTAGNTSVTFLPKILSFDIFSNFSAVLLNSTNTKSSTLSTAL